MIRRLLVVVFILLWGHAAAFALSSTSKVKGNSSTYGTCQVTVTNNSASEQVEWQFDNTSSVETITWPSTDPGGIDLSGLSTHCNDTTEALQLSITPSGSTYALATSALISNTNISVGVENNAKPNANAGPDQTDIASGANVNLNGSASSDADGDTLTYVWSQAGGDDVTLSSTTAASPNFTAPTIAAGEPDKVLTFSLVVNDGTEASDADTVTITVKAPTAPVNTKPVANAGADQTDIASGANVTLNGSASSDADGDTLTYAWTQTAGDTVALSSTTAASPNFTAPTIAAGEADKTLTFSLVVNDSTEDSDADTVTITVKAPTAPVNTKPVANAGADQTDIASGANVNLNGSASSDADGDTLTYAWTQTAGDTVALSSTTAASPNFTAPTIAAGEADKTLTFSLVVNDSTEDSDADTVTITVKAPTAPANTKPVANAGPDQTNIGSESTVTLDGSGSSDADGDTLTYTWTQTAGDTVTLSDTTSASPNFTAPTIAAGEADKTLTFSLVVNDGTENSDADTVTITVKATPAANTKPVANAGADQTDIASGTSVTLNGSGSSDADGDTLTYGWTQTSGDPVTLSEITSINPTFTAPTIAAGEADKTLTFSLVVNDSTEDSDADTVTITVKAPTAPANTKPVANAGPDQTDIASGATVTLDGSASSDADGDTLTYAWTQTAGDTVALSSTTAASPNFTAPTIAAGEADKTLTFSLVVNDSTEASDADTVTITVKAPANTKPVANAGPDQQNIGSEAVVTLNGSTSSDADGNTLTYAWTQTAGDTVTLSSTTIASPNFTAPTIAEGEADKTLTFSLVVNDGTENSDADTVTITVKATPAANTKPVANAGADQTDIASGANVTLNGSASSDGDSNPLTYEWTQTGGDDVTLSSTTAASPNFTAPTIAAGEADKVLTFSLTVNDGIENSDLDTVTITVKAPSATNTKPVANAGDDQNNIPSASTVILDGSASSDGDSDTLTYLWSQTSGDDVTLSSTTIASPTFTAPTVAEGEDDKVLVFQLVVNDGTENSEPATVTITVKAASDSNIPIANAGSNQDNIAPGATVTLDGSASSAATSGQSLTYSWSQTSGEPVTLSSTTDVSPTFTAPAINDGEADKTLVFSLIVNDETQNSEASTVTVTVKSPNGPSSPNDTTTQNDAIPPSVVISGAPDYFTVGESFKLQIKFSEPVTGLEVADVLRLNTDVSNLTGSGTDYEVTLTPTGKGDASVMVGAEAAQDAAGNLSLASNVVTIKNNTVLETQKTIADHMISRSNLLIANQPELGGFLSGSAGSLSGNGTEDNGDLKLETGAVSLSGDDYAGTAAWLNLNFAWAQNGTTESRSTIASAGAHYKLNPILLAGLMMQYDSTESEGTNNSVSGTGYLIGPYLVAKMPSQPLYIDARFLWGASSNEVSPFNTYTDEVETSRFLTRVKLAGDIKWDNITVTPNFVGTYVSDEQETYVDSLGNEIAGQTVETSQANFGVDLAMPLNVSLGTFTLRAGLDGIYYSTQVTGDAANEFANPEGWKARTDFGFDYQLNSATKIDLNLYYDGIGQEEQYTYGAATGVTVKF